MSPGPLIALSANLAACTLALDLTAIPGGDGILVVLEVNAGIVQDYGITVGSQMRHEVFSGQSAIWPC